MRSKTSWVIALLAVAVVVLIGVSAWLLFRSSGSDGEPRSLAAGLTRLQGVQELLAQLGGAGAVPEEEAAQYLREGAALEQDGRYREALAAYEKARDAAPDEAMPLMAMAGAYIGLGDTDEAMTVMEKAVELEPENANVQRSLGRLHCMRGELDPCTEALEKAAEMEPDDAWGRFWLASAYQRSAVDGFEKALAQYQEALRLDERFGEAHLGLAYLYQSRPGSEAESFEEFQMALDAALEAENEELATTARVELAAIYYAQDNYGRCIEESSKVVQAKPDEPYGHFRLGLCYAMRGREGDLDFAMAQLHESILLGGDHIDVYFFFLGQYHYTNEDYARAAWAWEQFLGFSNNDEVKDVVRSQLEAMTE